MLVEIKSSNRDLLTDSTSGLSPLLASGELDPRDVLRDINRSLAESELAPLEEAYLIAVKRQLIFREFARSSLEVQEYKHPAGARGKDTPEHAMLLAGKTGIPIVDACIAELKNGLPHNRARLLLARYAIRNLNLAPELVADFFRRFLKDYCPTINTFNVVSAASSATFGEPWYRLSNPLTAARKLDPLNRYIARFGFAGAAPSEVGQKSITEGNKFWQFRWKAAHESGDWIRRRLWPTKDKERGIYFVLDRLSARGAFTPYYHRYLAREDELLEP